VESTGVGFGMQYHHEVSGIGVIEAAQKGDAAAVKILLASSPSLTRAKDYKGYTAGHWAAYLDEVEVFQVLLDIDSTFLWDALTTSGMNCLHIACTCGSIRILRCILLNLTGEANGINATNQYKETGLHLAAASNKNDVAQLLLEAGIDASLCDQWGRSAIDVAIETGYIDIGKSIAHHVGIELPVGVDYHGCTPAAENDSNVAALKQSFSSELKSKLASSLHMRLEERARANESKDSSSSSSSSSSSFVKEFAEPEVKHIFKAISPYKNQYCSLSDFGVNGDTEDGCKTVIAGPLAKVALSKLVEYPGDPQKLRDIIVSSIGTEGIGTYTDKGSAGLVGTAASSKPSSGTGSSTMVDLNGKDMYGTTALMKFAAWDKVDLLAILLPYLTAEEINTTGGKEQLPCLHYCVDAYAIRALRVLLEDNQVDKLARDQHGRTWQEYALHLGKRDLLLGIEG